MIRRRTSSSSAGMLVASIRSFGGGLVDEVDRLVGQEAVGDVAVREDRRRDQRGVLDPDLVVLLVALAQAAQDRDRVLDRRLADEHRLEAALERGVLLDVLAVLVERRRADAVQLAAGEHRLEHVRGVHRALGRAGADDGVQLVDEQDDLALRRPVTSLRTALRRSSNSPRYFAPATSAPRSSATIRLSLSPSGTSPRTMRWASPSTIAVLPTPGSPISTGLFLVRATEHLDDAADLLVAADDRVELALPGQRGQVAAVLLERLVGGLRVRAGDALAAADLLERLVDAVAGDAEPAQDLAGRARLCVVGEGEQEVLGRDVVVLEALGLGLARRRTRGGSRFET